MTNYWEKVYEELPNGGFCPVCGHQLYTSDPPHTVYCQNPHCPECDSEVLEEVEFQEDEQ